MTPIARCGRATSASASDAVLAGGSTLLLAGDGVATIDVPEDRYVMSTVSLFPTSTMRRLCKQRLSAAFIEVAPRLAGRSASLLVLLRVFSSFTDLGLSFCEKQDGEIRCAKVGLRCT